MQENLHESDQSQPLTSWLGPPLESSISTTFTYFSPVLVARAALLSDYSMALPAS